MSSQEWARVWAAVHEERRALRSDLSHVPVHRWAEASLCPGWDVHDVVSHLIDSAKTTRLGFARRMLVARFDFDRDNAVGVVRERRASPAETLAEFGRIVTETKTPPAAPATRLVEAIVHGEDVRRPLGVQREYPLHHVLPALRHQLKTSVSMGGGRERAAGFRLVAVDADFFSGSGPDVHATALALLLALSGRPVRPTELAGSASLAFAKHLSAGPEGQ
ncbi:maleylpyruvate isomerase family mycothiol-dependent enzyme [Cryobacterium lactosi]|uniref:Maleylpyruvate isomerase family mycothiol-dependent enzyme n=2 Tax=Cryobacterium lactosi TaxID=1259202 RepID=A0A4R9BJ58_9MICO|nr:maleylpyruvate isomerase family mycothiol-dependent enzyme [Cryobacterium lactosi]TFD85775.1 maleylpyruvate isomerase family mycothiol-dependent enzyme [Cryobacterium lactosi]